MNPREYDATLRAARAFLTAGPFWLLDLWESLPPVVQDEVVETLATRESFRDAVEASGLTDTLDALARDEAVDDWLEAEGLSRAHVEALARHLRRAVQATNIDAEALPVPAGSDG
jgi:hypothetical protein